MGYCVGMKRGDIKRYRAYLNSLSVNTTNHHNGKYHQVTRLYGDYLYHQDREKFMVDMKEWLSKQKI